MWIHALCDVILWVRKKSKAGFAEELYLLFPFLRNEAFDHEVQGGFEVDEDLIQVFFIIIIIALIVSKKDADIEIQKLAIKCYIHKLKDRKINFLLWNICNFIWILIL